MKKVNVVLFLVFSLVVCSFFFYLPNVGAFSQVLGYQDSISTISYPVGGQLYGMVFSTSGWLYNYNLVGHGHAHIGATVEGGGYLGSHVKMVIVDDSLAVVAVSNSVEMDSWSDVYQFDFSGTVILTKSHANYTFCFIGDASFSWYGQTRTGFYLVDVSNSFASPTNPVDASVSESSSGGRTAWLEVDGTSGDPLATATPIPSVAIGGSSSGGFVVYFVVLILFAVVAVVAGLWLTAGDDSMNKGVALLFAFIAFVIFMVLFFGSGWFG